MVVASVNELHIGFAAAKRLRSGNACEASADDDHLLSASRGGTGRRITHGSHSGLLEPRGTSTVLKAPGVLDITTWSVMP